MLKGQATVLSASKKNIRVQQWVAIISVVLLAVKIIAYLITNSIAILTDALESIVNVVAGFVGLYSLYVSAKPHDEDHPYGHGKIEFISAALEGSMIFVAGFVIIYNAIKNIVYPAPLLRLDFGIVLIMATGVLNYIMGMICVRIGTKHKSMALQASGKHLQTDTYTTVGIVIGLVLIYFTEIFWIDSVIAILFAFIIIYTGYKILRTSIAGIMDETDSALLERIVDTLNGHRRQNWIDLHNLRIIKYGNKLHIDCHLTVPWYLNMLEAHNEIDAIRKVMGEAFSEPVEFFIHTDGCMEFQCPICDKADCPVRAHTLEKKIKWTVKNISRDKKHALSS
jgi:cation diffusion facilitator family transporter